MVVSIYIILIACISVFAIAAKYKFKKLYKVAKPFATLLIIGIPIQFSEIDQPHQYLILTGLCTALVGDMFLLNHDKYFKAGLFSFLLTHVFYSISFVLIVDNFNVLPALIFSVYAVSMFRKLNIEERILRYSVLIYTIVISVMGYTAVNAWLHSSGGNGLIIMVGASLFIVSDSVLAINKFAKSFRSAEFIILSTYYTSQILIAYSTLEF